MLSKYLSYGRFELYIFLIVILALINNCLYGLNHNEIFPEVRLCAKNFSKHYLIHELWSYLGTLIFAIIYNFNEIRSSRPEANDEERRERGFIVLIYAPIKINNHKLTTKIIYLYFLIIFFWVLIDQIIEYIYIMIFQDLDFWMVELFIITIIFYCNESKYSIITIYMHQKLAIILSIFPSLLKIASIVISFFDDTNEKDNYTGNLPIYYRKKPFLKISIGIIIYILLIIIRSYIYLTLKWYMDEIYISYNKILTVFGGMGTIVYSIICLLTTFIKCKKTYKDNNPIDYCDYLAKVQKYNNETNKIAYYFDSYSIYFNNFKDLNYQEVLREVIIIIIGIITFFYKKYFTLLAIHYLNPVYVIFSIPIKFLLQKVISFSYSLPKKNRKYFTKDYYKIYKFFLDLLGDIFSVFAFLIFLGIIVLHCYKLDINVRQNIMLRAFMDQNEANQGEESSENENEIDEKNNKLLEDSRNTNS